jgi:DNA-binding MarR family transcriptional regulator
MVRAVSRPAIRNHAGRTGDAALPDLAARLQRSAAALARRLRAATPLDGLTPARLGILAALRRSRHGTPATALAAELGIQPQSLTRLLAELEDRRLIARRSDAADRRRSLIGLTAAGRSLLEAELQRRRAALAETIAALFTPAERQALDRAADLIGRLADALPRAGEAAGSREDDDDEDTTA